MDFEKMKQEIMTEMRKEMKTMKEEIIDGKLPISGNIQGVPYKKWVREVLV